MEHTHDKREEIQPCCNGLALQLEGLTAAIKLLTQQIEESGLISQNRQHAAEPHVSKNENSPKSTGGCALAATAELLEMILLKLPRKDILRLRRVSQQFNHVVTRSSPLQRRLFLTPEPTTLPFAKVKLNPIVSAPHILLRLPIFLDSEKRTLAYCDRKGRQRLYCHSATIVEDEVTGEGWVHLEFTPDYPRPGLSLFHKPPKLLGAGTWKDMYLSRGSCGVKWRVTLENYENVNSIGLHRRLVSTHTYYGAVNVEHVLDLLLEDLSDVVMEHVENLEDTV